MKILRPVIIFLGLIAAWEVVVLATGAPHYILPGPLRVARALIARWPELLGHAGVTVTEILLGLALGVFLGCLSALVIASFPPARRWLLPVLVVSQAIPVFALAPVLVLWLGYGLASKVAMATLIIYFPVTAAFFDGLRRTEPGWLDLARTMGGGRMSILRHIQVPAALPALSSGIRVATAVAPIGAVVATRMPELSAGRAAGTWTWRRIAVRLPPMVRARSSQPGSVRRRPSKKAAVTGK